MFEAARTSSQRNFPPLRFGSHTAAAAPWRASLRSLVWVKAWCLGEGTDTLLTHLHSRKWVISWNVLKQRETESNRRRYLVYTLYGRLQIIDIIQYFISSQASFSQEDKRIKSKEMAEMTPSSAASELFYDSICSPFIRHNPDLHLQRE